MSLLVLLLLLVLLAGAGGFGAWRVPAYRSEWIGLAAIFICLLLLFYGLSPAPHPAPPVIVR